MGIRKCRDVFKEFLLPVIRISIHIPLINTFAN